MDESRNSERSNEGASGSDERPQPTGEHPSLVVELDEESPQRREVHHYRCPPPSAPGPIVHHYHHQHCPQQPCLTTRTPTAATDRAETAVSDLQRSLVEITREALDYVAPGDRRLISIGRSAVNIVRRTSESIDGLRRDIHNLRFSTSPPRRYAEPAEQGSRGRPQGDPGPYRPPHRRNNTSDSRSGWSDWEPIAVFSPSRPTQPDRNQRSRSPARPSVVEWDEWDTAPPGQPGRVNASGNQYSASQIRATSGYMRSELVRLRDSHGELTLGVAWRAFVNRLINRGLYQSEQEVSRAWEIAFGHAALRHFGYLWVYDLESLRRNLPAEAARAEDLVRF